MATMSHRAPSKDPHPPTNESVSAVMMQVVPWYKKPQHHLGPPEQLEHSSLASRGGTARRESKTTRPHCVVLFLRGRYFKAQTFSSRIFLEKACGSGDVRVLRTPSRPTQVLLWKLVSPFYTLFTIAAATDSWLMGTISLTGLGSGVW